ncbi:hypothetical protein nbrc107696_35470 [Gordonia spumicola]|uniref:Transposase DDE domain-containing protein n=1 Tax=Gordonia spumicola TaxID=589161 RepID=A0A7I9VD67_9ACTN|nr:hypothetical protein nbrc107696_35470 [Gordonia spumicola]
MPTIPEWTSPVEGTEPVRARVTSEDRQLQPTTATPILQAFRCGGRSILTVSTDGTGEAFAAILRPGNAGANTAADRITLTTLILDQIPDIGSRPGKSILIRTDSAGGIHAFVDFLTRRRLSYSVGFG